MKRLTLTILILGILGFSLLAITGLSYAEDDKAFALQLAALGKKVHAEMLKTNPEAAIEFQKGLNTVLKTMPGKSEYIEYTENILGNRKDASEIERDNREKIVERYTEGGSGNHSNGGGTSGSGGATTGGGGGFKLDTGVGTGLQN